MIMIMKKQLIAVGQMWIYIHTGILGHMTDIFHAGTISQMTIENVTDIIHAIIVYIITVNPAINIINVTAPLATSPTTMDSLPMASSALSLPLSKYNLNSKCIMFT